MIFIKLKDGLGNQLFQYAFARNLQLYHKERKIYMSTADFARADSVREYSLNHFKLNSSAKVCNKFQELCLRGIRKMAVLRKGKGLYVYNEPYQILPADKCKTRIKIIEGFFQTAKNFEDIREMLLDELTVTTPPSAENVQMLEMIAKEENPVCVHIRRGDYVNDPRWSKSLCVCDEEYYKKALDIIAEKVENPTFFVFSNCSEDIQWIKDNYNFSYNINYIDLNNPDYEELRLMYSCKHFVLSNSTFSWWGQYLSRNEDKVVVAPSVWNKKYDDSTIYMDNWEIVEV